MVVECEFGPRTLKDDEARALDDYMRTMDEYYDDRRAYAAAIDELGDVATVGAAAASVERLPSRLLPPPQRPKPPQICRTCLN